MGFSKRIDFNGAKVAVLYENKLVMQLRDDKPGLRFANMWDFPGGGRENLETPKECAIREIQEELGIALRPEVFVWEKQYPAMHDPNQKAYFLVAKVTQTDIENIQFGSEGQRWDLFSQKLFFESSDVVPDLKGRFKDYLEENK